jgi:hypothetical protein
MSGKHMLVTSECVASPGLEANGRWVFINRDDVLGRAERLEIDREGRTLLQEIPPLFEARRSGTGARDRGPEAKGALSDMFVIRKSPRPAGASVKLRLTEGVTLGDSVLQFYTAVGDGYLLDGVPDSCAHADGGRHGKAFLDPTVTMQSDHPEIVRLARRLKGTMVSDCDIVARCTEYVHDTIEKRGVATFSSALETLKAGFGDCGEHAVLLAALLRAAGIPARVVLGLVHVPQKGGYLYHAWVMALAGSDWVFADPAMGGFPAADGLVPLLIDDSGENSVLLGKLLGRVEIVYDR